MKILVITSSFPDFPGDAAGHFVESEVQELVARGHQVMVMAPARGAVPCASPDAPYLRLHFPSGDLFGPPGAWPRCKARPWRLWALVPASWALWRARANLGEVDLVIAHWLVPCGLPWGLLMRRQRKLIVVLHGTDLDLLLRLPTLLLHWILELLVKNDVSLRFVSAAMQARLLERARSNEVREMVQHGEVRPSPLVLPPALDQPSARLHLGIPAATRLVVMVGRLIPQKRMETALYAASLIPHAELVVLGQGPEGPQLQAKFPSARFLGQVDRPEALCWLTAADVVISASRREGAPTAIREALALGTMVVSPPVADLPAWSSGEPALWLVD